jgi:hypothetical protein
MHLLLPEYAFGILQGMNNALSESYDASHSQPVSQFVLELSSSGARYQILAVDKTITG